MDPISQPGLFVLVVMIAPALLAGAVLLVGDLARRGQPLAWIGALAAGVAYLLGHFFALTAPPKFPPASSTDALYWSGGIALAAGLAVGWRSRSVVVQAAAVALASAGATWFTLQRLVGRMESNESTVLFAAAALAPLVAFLGWERTARLARGWTAPAMLWIATSAAAACHALSGAAAYAANVGVLAAVLGAAVVLGFLRPNLNLAGGFGAVVIVQNATLAAAGAKLAELPGLAALALALAPAASALVGESRAQALGARKAAWVRAALVGVFAAIAIGLAAYAHFERKNASPYGY